MATDKKRVSTYLADDEVRMLDAIVDLLHLNPQNGRSEAIEAALKFYFAYLSNQMNTDYLCGIYGRQVEAIVQRATDRISSQLFKQAVETNMLTRIVAFEYELSKDEYFNWHNQSSINSCSANLSVPALYAAIFSSK